MNKMIMIVPVNGVKVRNPETKNHLDSKGEILELTDYWIRREISGEVIFEELHLEEIKTSLDKKINK